MKAIKAFRKLNFKKTSVVEIEEMFIPIRTLSIAEENAIRINIPFGIPSKIEVLSEKDRLHIKKTDPSYNPVAYPAVKIYDKASIQYINYEEDLIKYNPILDGIKYIDFDYIVDDAKNQTFLDYLIENEGIDKANKTKINWLELCKYFDSIGITDDVINAIIIEIKGLKGDTVFSKISKLSSITGMDYIEIISKLENIIDADKTILEQNKTIDELYEQMDTLKLSIEKNVVDSDTSEESEQSETLKTNE
jgi:hypothetical protein